MPGFPAIDRRNGRRHAHGLRHRPDRRQLDNSNKFNVRGSPLCVRAFPGGRNSENNRQGPQRRDHQISLKRIRFERQRDRPEPRLLGHRSERSDGRPRRLFKRPKSRPNCQCVSPRSSGFSAGPGLSDIRIIAGTHSIDFSVPNIDKAANLRLDLFTLQGKYVQTLFNARTKGGKFSVPFGQKNVRFGAAAVYCAVLSFGRAEILPYGS